MNMKKIFNIITILLLTVFTTSCLDSNLEDLDTYKGKDIIGIAGVYHRYYGSQTIPGSGEQQVLQSALSYDNFQADAETGTSSFECKLPSNFPAEERPKFTTSNVVVSLNISTAAMIQPIDGAAVLGKPGDWSKPNKYEITAADGSKKVWTITAYFLQE